MDNSTNLKNKNLLYIGIATAIILIIILALALRGCHSKNEPQPTSVMSVIDEKGNQNATIATEVKVRKISFDKTKKQIMAFEKKQKDTLDNPSESTSSDDYTYLSYKFNPKNPASFFGAKVLPDDPSAMLTYVFHKKQLIEVRIQYGKIGKSSYNSMVSYNMAEYGESSYSRTYSNGTDESWWRTSKATLDVLCQDDDVIVYYRSNTKS